MNFKKLFARKKLSSFLSFSQQGNVWRMFFTNNKLIAGETRDTINKQVYFFVINYENCNVLLKNFQLNEKWWISICDANDRFIFLSSYRKPDMPEYLGITTVDISSGNIPWQRDDLTFLYAEEEHIYAYKQLFESKKYYKLDSRSGEILSEITGNQEIDTIYLLKQKLETQRYKDFIYPVIYNPELSEANNEDAEYFLSRFKNSKLKGFIEYANYEDYLIYNFHELKGIDMKDIAKQILTNKLEVYNGNIGKIVYEEILNLNVSNYVPDSFFIKDSYLFYIKEKTELTSIKLSK